MIRFEKEKTEDILFFCFAQSFRCFLLFVVNLQTLFFPRTLRRALSSCRRLRCLTVTVPGLTDEDLNWAAGELGQRIGKEDSALTELHLSNQRGSLSFRCVNTCKKM